MGGGGGRRRWAAWLRALNGAPDPAGTAIFLLRSHGPLSRFRADARQFFGRFDFCGAVAQLGERYNGIVEVVGSRPSGSTKINGLADSLLGHFLLLHEKR